MCSSLEQVARDIDLNIGTDFTTLYNYTSPSCSQVVCDVINTPFQSLNMSVHSCDSPPSIDLSITIRGEAHSYNIGRNQSISLSDFLIEVQIWHYNYSMDIQVLCEYVYTCVSMQNRYLFICYWFLLVTKNITIPQHNTQTLMSCA